MTSNTPSASSYLEQTNQESQPFSTLQKSTLAESGFIPAENNPIFIQDSSTIIKNTETPSKPFETTSYLDTYTSPYKPTSPTQQANPEFSTTGLTSPNTAQSLKNPLASTDTKTSDYGISTNYHSYPAYQYTTNTEANTKLSGTYNTTPGEYTQDLKYSITKREPTSPAIQALNETTAALLGKSSTKNSGVGQELGLGEKTISFGTTAYTDYKDYKPYSSADYQIGSTYGTSSTEYKPPTISSYDSSSNSYGIGTFGAGTTTTTNYYSPNASSYLITNTTNKQKIYQYVPATTTLEETKVDYLKKSGDEILKKGGLTTNDSTLQRGGNSASVSSYKDLINKPSRHEKTASIDGGYTILKPGSQNTSDIKQRPTYGSQQYQSTYIHTPNNSAQKNNDRYISAEISGIGSPPFRRDMLETNHPDPSDIVISEPSITKKTTYTIENPNIGKLNSSKSPTRQSISALKTPERRSVPKVGSPSPFDDLKQALRGENVQISKIIIETVENFEEGEDYGALQGSGSKGNNRLDIAMEELVTHVRNESFESPYKSRPPQEIRVEDSGIFRDSYVPKKESPKKSSNLASGQIGGTISAINDRIRDLDEFLDNRSSRLSNPLNTSPTPRKEREINLDNIINKNPVEEVKRTSYVQSTYDYEIENIRQRNQPVVEEKKVPEVKKEVKEVQKKEEPKKAVLPKEAVQEKKDGKESSMIAKAVIAFLVILLSGILFVELGMGTEEFEQMMDS